MPTTTTQPHSPTPPRLGYAPVGQSPRNLLARLTSFREFMIVLIILAASAFMSYQSPVFRSGPYQLSLLLSVSVESIVAIGMTILLVSGGFDLSVGSTVAFTGAVAAWCIARLGIPVPLAILAALASGAFIGLSNGLIVAKLNINPFITTLGTMGIVRGALEVITEGQNITGLPQSFKSIGQDNLFGIIQYPIVIALILISIGDLLLRKSRFFRQNYYIGGNEKAALLSGIPVNAVKIFNYTLIGFLAAIAGIVNTARLGSASVTAAQGLELKVITAVIIGGASLQGGEGTILGAFLGSFLMAIIVGSLPLLDVPIYYNKLVIGATLLLAVLIDTLGKKARKH
jgi:ribose transport system permease protein